MRAFTLFFCLISLTTTSCTQMAMDPGAEHETKYYDVPTVEETQVLMGTVTRLRLPATSKKYFKPVFKLFEKYEKQFSPRQPISEPNRLNLEKSRKISASLKYLLQRAQENYVYTNGYYKYAVDLSEEDGPEQKSPTNLDPLVTLSGNVATLGPKVRLDLGGIMPGFAVDRAAKHLKSKGVKIGIAKIGGDIRCIDRCHMEISHPFIPKETVFVMEFWTQNKDMSLSTETLPQKLDIRYSPDKIVSASVLTQNDTIKSRAVATALTRMPLQEALKYINDHPENGYAIFTQDRRAWVSPGLRTMTEDVLWPSGQEQFKISSTSPEANSPEETTAPPKQK